MQVRMEGGKLLPLPLSPLAGCGMKGLSNRLAVGKGKGRREENYVCPIYMESNIGRSREGNKVLCGWPE